MISNGSRCPLKVFTVISTADTVSLTLVWSGLFDRMECLNLCQESKYNDLTNTWSFRNCYISDIFESSIWTLDLQMFQTFENITLPTSNTVSLYDEQLYKKKRKSFICLIWLCCHLSWQQKRLFRVTSFPPQFSRNLFIQQAYDFRHTINTLTIYSVKLNRTIDSLNNQTTDG